MTHKANDEFRARSVSKLEVGAGIAIHELTALLRYVQEDNYMHDEEALASVLRALQALTNGLGDKHGLF